jgi:hypothetical protein
MRGKARLGLGNSFIRLLEFGLYRHPLARTHIHCIYCRLDVLFSLRFSKLLELVNTISSGNLYKSSSWQGYSYLKSYLYRLGYSNSDLCYCEKTETAEHLLFSCEKLRIAYKKLQDKLQDTRLSLPVLLHIKTGIEKTLGFLRVTSIITRKEHLAKQEEEETKEEDQGELAA